MDDTEFIKNFMNLDDKEIFDYLKGKFEDLKYEYNYINNLNKGKNKNDNDILIKFNCDKSNSSYDIVKNQWLIGINNNWSVHVIKDEKIVKILVLTIRHELDHVYKHISDGRKEGLNSPEEEFRVRINDVKRYYEYLNDNYDKYFILYSLYNLLLQTNNRIDTDRFFNETIYFDDHDIIEIYKKYNERLDIVACLFMEYGHGELDYLYLEIINKPIINIELLKSYYGEICDIRYKDLQYIRLSNSIFKKIIEYINNICNKINNILKEQKYRV